MPDGSIESEEAPQKKKKPADLGLSTGPETDIKKKEEPIPIENDTAAVNEAAQQAEKAVIEAVKAMAQIIESMKS
jgi:hypothetical protein